MLTKPKPIAAAAVLQYADPVRSLRLLSQHLSRRLMANAALTLTSVALAIACNAPADAAPHPDTLALDLPTVETIKERQTVASERPRRYGVTIPTVTPRLHDSGLGTWRQLPDGRMEWSLDFKAKDAAGLEFSFSKLRLPRSAVMVVQGATPDSSHTITAETLTRGAYRTPLVVGDLATMVVELDARDIGRLQMDLASYTFAFADPFAKSQSCNHDVACAAGNGLEDQIASVALYTATDGVDNWACTGTLMANTNNTSTPYFLTARHCDVHLAGVAATMTIYWNYENPTCRVPGSAASGAPIAYNATHIQFGAVLRASWADSDFTLLELNQTPSTHALAYHAGWDRSGVAPASTYGIHHPAGDEKRISKDNQAPSPTLYLGIPGSGSTHWRVLDWDIGSTEDGSSGSPLFSSANLVIGQLHGGDAACGNNEPDWYGRLSRSWTGGGNNATRLSNWLDPAASGVNSKSGYYPSATASNTRFNKIDLAIPSNATVNRTINIAGMPAVNGTVGTRIKVRLNHTAIGDLRVRAIAPDGDIYTLHNYSGGVSDNLFETYIVNTTSSPRNGVWTLQINDNQALDNGLLDSWSITF